MTLTNSPGFPSSTSFQPGGVMSGFTSNLNTRFISSMPDPLGRWICHRFRGKERDSCIYSIYRVHRKTDEASGLTTAWMQQRVLPRAQKILDNPRDAVIKDICDRVKKDIDAHRSVILLCDFNEGLDSKEKTFDKLYELRLINMMQERMTEPLPKPWNRGKTAIDHIFMTVDVARSFKKAGFAPFDLISLSDHRGLFFDLDMLMLFDEKSKDIEPAKFRKLQSSNLKRVQKYNKLLEEEWDLHKIDLRLQTLADDFKNEGPNIENVKRLNDLDQHITDIMRYSEKNCTTISRHAKDPWSPKLKEVAREIRYLIVEIKNCIRDKFPISLVECMEKITTLQLRLNRKRNEYRDFLKSAAAYRELHLDEQAQYHVEIGKNSKKASEVKRLKHIE